MSINSEITRFSNAKADLKFKIEYLYNKTIPSSALLDTYVDYITPTGCYIKTPTANGVYIKYSDNTYSNYNVLGDGKTAAGVSLKTDNVAICIHPSQGGNTRWQSKTGTTVANIPTVTSGAANYSDGSSYTTAALAGSNIGTAFSSAHNAVYTNGATGGLPSPGEGSAIYANRTNINTALTNIGGATISSSYTYGLSLQYSSNNGGKVSGNSFGNASKTTYYYCRSITNF